MELREAVLAAFPIEPIARAILDEPTNYEERDQLGELAGKTWRDIAPAFVMRHANLLTYAGPALFRALLPAYLLYLLDHDAFNEVPFHVAGQLTRKDDPIDHAIFDRRVAGLTAAQRTAIHRAVAQLATREPMQKVMSRALATWDVLEPST